MDRVETAGLRRLALLAACSLLLAAIPVVRPLPAQAAVSKTAFEKCLLNRANAARSAAGVGKLRTPRDLVPAVRGWSRWMRFNEFTHMDPSLRQDILPDTWTAYGENIAMHPNEDMANCGAIHNMLMNSSGHRENILSPNFRFVVMGAYVDGSGWWVTQLFFNATSYELCNGRGTTKVGTAGNDVIRGTNGNDVIHAMGGDDVVYARGGRDLVCGTAGADRIYGGPGPDRLIGGYGNDTLRGGPQADVLLGGNRADQLLGGKGSDTLRGNKGPDVLRGNTGPDTLLGNIGQDSLRGQQGADRLFGGPDADECLGGTGSDTANSCKVKTSVP